jgi:hypothetical protein
MTVILNPAFTSALIIKNFTMSKRNLTPTHDKSTIGRRPAALSSHLHSRAIYLGFDGVVVPAWQMLVGVRWRTRILIEEGRGARPQRSAVSGFDYTIPGRQRPGRTPIPGPSACTSRIPSCGPRYIKPKPKTPRRSLRVVVIVPVF